MWRKDAPFYIMDKAWLSMTTRIDNMTNTTPPEIRISINGTTYISKAWPTRSKAFKNFPIIGKAFAVPISFLFNAGSTGDVSGAISQALYMLFEQLEQNDSDKLLDTILADVFIIKDGGVQALDIDAHIPDIEDLFALVAEVLNQHYGKLIKGKAFGNLINILIPMSQATQAQ